MSYLPVIGACILPNLGGFAGGFITRPQINTWYKPLRKPSWTPPSWVIAPIWITLYTGMGFASYLIWKETGGFRGEGKWPLALYGTQLVLNWIWSPIFFGKHKMGLALIDILVLYGTVCGCTYLFYPINRTASYIMLPYLAWLSLATALNYCLWRNNPQHGSMKRED